MAKELELKYGCNPNQKTGTYLYARRRAPIEVLNGRPGYINFLDALNGWQLVKELKEATGPAGLQHHSSMSVLQEQLSVWSWMIP